MAKRSSAPPPQPQPSHRQIQSAIARFRGIIQDLENFDPQTVQQRADPRIKVLEIAIDEALIDAFGRETPQYVLYRRAAAIDTARHNYLNAPPLGEIIQGLVLGKDRAIALLGQAVNLLKVSLLNMMESTPKRRTSGQQKHFHPTYLLSMAMTNPRKWKSRYLSRAPA